MAPYLDGVNVVEHDVRDTAGFRTLLERHEPAEVYNLAGFSSVGASWEQPELALETNGRAVGAMVEVLAEFGGARFFQASSAEELDSGSNSPYAQGKRAAHEYVRTARDAHGVFACAGMLYNHESPLRGRHFVTRKITRAAAEIAAGQRDKVQLGNLDVARDWGHAKDYVNAMVLMLRHDTPEDFTVATGISHTLEQLLVTAFEAAGLSDPWQYVEQDPSLIRPTDAESMVGDASRAREVLVWAPTTTFTQLVAEMVAVDVRRVETGIEESLDYLSG